MALTPSNMLPLGTKAPDFQLPDTISGSIIKMSEYSQGHITVVMFLCNHCPYVLHVNVELVRIANHYSTLGVKFLAISSNDVDRYPQDGPDEMSKHGKEVGYSFPYLYDESQEVAKAYDAACTPDLYVFDQNSLLVYRGRLDDSRPNNGIELSGRDLRSALDALLVGKHIPEPHYPSMGCNIKWKLA
jgi:peroxiredoxin